MFNQIISYKATEGSGISIITSVNENGNTTPTEFNLSQNFPNPFNPATIIRYTLSSRQFVSIKVYDMLGNEIATLVNENKPAGNFEVHFNGTGLPSGVYLYKLIVGNFAETKKMILLK